MSSNIHPVPNGQIVWLKLKYNMDYKSAIRFVSHDAHIENSVNLTHLRVTSHKLYSRKKNSSTISLRRLFGACRVLNMGNFSLFWSITIIFSYDYKCHLRVKIKKERKMSLTTSLVNNRPMIFWKSNMTTRLTGQKQNKLLIDLSNWMFFSLVLFPYASIPCSNWN